MDHIKHVSLVLVLVCMNIFAPVAGQCKFSAKDVEYERRLVAIQKRGKFEIFDQDDVPLDTTLHFICSDDDVVKVKCNRDNSFNHTLPIENCDKPPKAGVREISDDNCKAQAYSIGYEFRGQYLEIYRSCFDKDAMSVLLTTHIGNPYSIVNKRPLASFTRDGVVTVKDATSYQAKSIFNRFNNLLGPDQNYITSQREIVIDRGHLVPSADFVFELNMNATFKYINVIPQFSSINRGNWKSVENYIRKRIDETGKGRIWTGSFDVLQLVDNNHNQVPIYLLDNRKNPVPKWIFKMFRNEVESVAFLTYNNIFDPLPPRAVCSTITCPINLKNSEKSGFTFCCDPEDFLRNVFPYVH